MSLNKESVKREWTDDEVMELIHLYEEHEFLWNVKHKAYRNREKKMSMFDEFAKKFQNCDGYEVQRKIHNLRNQVSHEIQKMKKLKSGDGEEDRYESKWKFFSTLKFVIPNFTPTSTTSNIGNTDDSLEVVGDEETDEPQNKRRKTSNKKTPRTPEDDILKEAIEIMKKPKDDYDCFGEYVAMELRSLKSDYNKGQLKSAIRKAIVHFSDLDERNFWSSAPTSSSSSAVNSTPSTPIPNVANNTMSLDGLDDIQTAQDYYNTMYKIL